MSNGFTARRHNNLRTDTTLMNLKVEYHIMFRKGFLEWL